jgi:hypothetical protein
VFVLPSQAITKMHVRGHVIDSQNLEGSLSASIVIAIHEVISLRRIMVNVILCVDSNSEYASFSF